MPERADAIPEAAVTAVMLALRDWRWDESGDFDRQARDVIRRLLPHLRAAQPEADRAPGEVDAARYEAVARALSLGHGWTEDANIGAVITSFGPDAERVIAALDALRSEQGQSRDDTVTLAEVIRECVEYPGASAPVGWKRRARGALARLGAGRAEGEDRDTENER